MKNSKKNKGHKQATSTRLNNDQLGENASEEYKSSSYDNANKENNKKNG